MSSDQTGVTVTIRRTLEKFDGDYKPGDVPVETSVSEETVPLSSLPVALQQQLTKRKKGKE